MSDRVVIGQPMGPWRTNCYVLGDRSMGECVVVDPGMGADSWVPEVLDRLGMTLTGVLLTHAHVDHLFSAPALAAAHDVEVHLHPDDVVLWHDPQTTRGPAPRSVLMERHGLDWRPDDDRLAPLSDGQRLVRAGITFTVAHTPGHSPGHCTFLAGGLGAATFDVAPSGPDPADEVLLSGDLLFRGSIGRMDLRGGSPEAMRRSLARTVLPMGDDTLVLCGHGPHTTVGHERATNGYLAEVAR